MKKIEQHMVLVLALFPFTVSAQENPIFHGGAYGGSAFGCHVQSNNNTIFAGGPTFSLGMDCAVEEHTYMDVIAFMKGPYDNGTGLMKDDLRQLAIVPINEPYAALGMAENGGESIDLAVLVTNGPTAIVDWVLMELRDPIDPAYVLEHRAALLRADGKIVDVDGASPVRIRTNMGSAFIAIKHRNHLGIMLEDMVSLAADTILLDASDPLVNKFGAGATTLINGRDMLWSGNTKQAGNVVKYTGSNNDRDPILIEIGGSIPTNTVQGYSVNDVNMDGTVRYTGQNNDRDPILVNIGGSIPTATLPEQLP